MNSASKTMKDIKKELERIDKLTDLDVKEYADTGGYADRIAKLSKDDLKPTQLRKFFNAIKDMEKNSNKWEDLEMNFYMLKPQLANAVGRKLVPPEFYEIFIELMEKVDRGTDEDKINNFRVFVRFVEAIVAYHKYYYPKAG